MRAKWTREETILALFLYLFTEPKGKDKQNEDLLAVAQAISRTPDAVAMKVANLISCGSKIGEPVGLRHGSSLDKIIWDEFNDKPTNLFVLGVNILHSKDIFDIKLNKLGLEHMHDMKLYQSAFNDTEELNDDTGFPEGREKYITHLTRERNRKVVRIAKESFKKQNGHLYCEVCGFDFVKMYGDLGEDFIEAHHIIPVSELKDGHKTTVDEIAIICSNCHRMLHRRRPWLMREELKSLVLEGFE